MRKLIPLLLAILLLAACSPQQTPEEAPASEAPAAAATAAPTPEPSPEPEGPYEALTAKIQIGAPVAAQAVESSASLDLREDIVIQTLFSLPSAARGMAIIHPDAFVYAGSYQDGGNAIFGGSLVPQAGQVPERPYYVAPEDFPHIDSLTGTRMGFYFVEYNDAAWRLLFKNLENGEDEEPQLIDHGDGPPPKLVSSEGDMVYAVETAQGFEMRVWQRHWDEGISSQLLGVITLPDDTLDADRWFLLNEMGATHCERGQGGHLLVAENLMGIRAVIRTQGFLRQATVGSNAVAWLGEDGSFCAYDPEGDRAYSYGQQIDWYAPLDVYGEGYGYLFGGREGLFVMAWNLDSEEMELSVYPIDQGNEWIYTQGAVTLADTHTAYVIRQRGQEAELCKIVLGVTLEDM